MKLTADAPPLRYGDVMEHPLIRGFVVMVISEGPGTIASERIQHGIVLAQSPGYAESSYGRPGTLMTGMTWVADAAPAILIERGPA